MSLTLFVMNNLVNELLHECISVDDLLYECLC